MCSSTNIWTPRRDRLQNPAKRTYEIKTNILSAAFLTFASMCFGQAKPADPKSSNEATIIDLEKATWEAFKNKQADAFKKYLATDYRGVYDDGIESRDAETANMAATELRSYSFTDTKMTFPQPDVAIITYKTAVEQTVKGKDESGTYNSGSVWVKQNGNWVTVLHSDVKVK
jgi:hypothetical protein